MAGALPGAAAAAGQVESAGRRRYRTDQYVIYIYVYIYSSASHVLQKCSAFGFVSCCLQIRSVVQGLGRRRGQLGCSDRRGR